MPCSLHNFASKEGFATADAHYTTLLLKKALNYTSAHGHREFYQLYAATLRMGTMENSTWHFSPLRCAFLREHFRLHASSHLDHRVFYQLYAATLRMGTMINLTWHLSPLRCAFLREHFRLNASSHLDHDGLLGLNWLLVEH
jgi:hypothetical protein